MKKTILFLFPTVFFSLFCCIDINETTKEFFFIQSVPHEAHQNELKDVLSLLRERANILRRYFLPEKKVQINTNGEIASSTNGKSFFLAIDQFIDTLEAEEKLNANTDVSYVPLSPILIADRTAIEGELTDNLLFPVFNPLDKEDDSITIRGRASTLSEDSSSMILSPSSPNNASGLDQASKAESSIIFPRNIARRVSGFSKKALKKVISIGEMKAGLRPSLKVSLEENRLEVPSLSINTYFDSEVSFSRDLDTKADHKASKCKELISLALAFKESLDRFIYEQPQTSKPLDEPIGKLSEAYFFFVQLSYLTGNDLSLDPILSHLSNSIKLFERFIISPDDFSPDHLVALTKAVDEVLIQMKKFKLGEHLPSDEFFLTVGFLCSCIYVELLSKNPGLIGRVEFKEYILDYIEKLDLRDVPENNFIRNLLLFSNIKWIIANTIFARHDINNDRNFKLVKDVGKAFFTSVFDPESSSETDVSIKNPLMQALSLRITTTMREDYEMFNQDYLKSSSESNETKSKKKASSREERRKKALLKITELNNKTMRLTNESKHQIENMISVAEYLRNIKEAQPVELPYLK